MNTADIILVSAGTLLSVALGVACLIHFFNAWGRDLDDDMEGE